MTKRNELAEATMAEKAETDHNSNIQALGTIIQKLCSFSSPQKSPVARLTKLAITEPLSAFIEATAALQQSFERGWTLGLEEAYDTIRRIPLENKKLTREERQLLLDTVFETPSVEKTEALLAKLKE